MKTELLQTDLIALNAATPELLMDWFESLNNWGWPVFLIPYDEDRRGILIAEIENRVGPKALWRPNRIKWHADIKMSDNKVLLFDSTYLSKDEAYIDILRAAHDWNVYKGHNIVISIDDLQPGRSSHDCAKMV